MSQEPLYSIGEKVLCFHGPLLYEAKCLKLQIKDKTIKYLIHYSGWNKNWDEWVPESRVLEYNEVNLGMQNQLAETVLPKSKKSKGSKSASKKAIKKEKEKEREKEKEVPILVASEKPVKQPKSLKREAAEIKLWCNCSSIEYGFYKGSKSASKKAIEKEKEKEREREREKEKEGTILVAPEKPVKQPKSLKREAAGPPSESLSKPSDPKKSKLPVEPKRLKPPVESKKLKPPVESKRLKPPVESKRSKPPVERKFEEEPKCPVEVKFTIPETLKCWLLDDMDLITYQKKLLRLPARVTVDHVIANYVKEKVATAELPARKEITIIRVANRIRDCFNVLLGKQLLNKFERPQYAEILLEHPDKQMCEIYGAIHMLRMITPVGKMLSTMSESGKDVSLVVSHMEAFIEYMSLNPSFFSLNDYVVSSPEYQRRAMV